MNLICKLLGHKWFTTSHVDYDRSKPPEELWIDERICLRCNTADRIGTLPFYKVQIRRETDQLTN